MSRPAQPLRLHGFPLSGHAHRARLMLSLLDLPHEVLSVDLPAGEHRQPAFLALNPLGQVPVLQDGDFTLADSNAILVYLATRYDDSRRWLPTDARAQAQVQRWLGVAAGPLAAGAATARVNVLFRRPHDAGAVETAKRLFTMMEQHLQPRTWLVGEHATIADVALHTYTAHAPEGGVPLEPYPALRAWLQRVEALPGFVGMQRSPRPE